MRSFTSQAIYNSSFKDKNKPKKTQRAFLSPAPAAKNPNLIDLEYKEEQNALKGDPKFNRLNKKTQMKVLIHEIVKTTRDPSEQKD